MLKTLGQTLLVLIATIMVADPLMACCFPASFEPATVSEASQPEADKPPCHGARAVTASENPERSDSSCPGCGDCASMMSAAEHIQTLALVGSAAEFELDAVNVSTQSVANSQIDAAPDIPSGPPARVATTPVTLKLKLHI